MQRESDRSTGNVVLVPIVPTFFGGRGGQIYVDTLLDYSTYVHCTKVHWTHSNSFGKFLSRQAFALAATFLLLL
jgi:hypothetical protein